jgi:hypothetical protein
MSKAPAEALVEDAFSSYERTVTVKSRDILEEAEEN